MESAQHHYNVATTPRLFQRTRKITTTPAPAHRQTRSQHDQSTIENSLIISQEPQEENWGATRVLNVSWRLYKATPLYNFQVTDISLKRMARSLSATLQAELARGIGIALDVPESEMIGADSIVHVNAEQIPELRGSKRDAEAFSLMITRQQVGRSDLIGRMVLCSVGYGELVASQPLPEGFTHLPLVLVRASASLIRILTSWIQETFDCLVTPMPLSTRDLEWMAVEWAAPDGDDGSLAQRPLALIYSLPGDKSLQTITYNIEPDSIRSLQLRLSCYNQGRNLMDALETHFYKEFSIRLNKMRLVRVGTYTVFVGHEGRIKLLPLPSKCSTESLLVLKYLTNVAIRSLISYDVN